MSLPYNEGIRNGNHNDKNDSFNSNHNNDTFSSGKNEEGKKKKKKKKLFNLDDGKKNQDNINNDNQIFKLDNK